MEILDLSELHEVGDHIRVEQNGSARNYEILSRDKMTGGYWRYTVRVDGRLGDWIQTFTGKQFWPLDPRVSEVDIRDIAHSLSNQCRFAGHCKVFYSVAEHCVRLSHEVSEDNALWGLLHDSSEAYLIDLPRPLKRGVFGKSYVEHETRLMFVVCARFDLSVKMPKEVEDADARMLLTEKRDILGPSPADWGIAQGRTDLTPYKGKIRPWKPKVAEDRFNTRFAELLFRRKNGLGLQEKIQGRP